MFIQIVVPCYNDGERFKEVVYPSIANQTFQDFHLVVVDDMTDDGSWSLKDLTRVDKRNKS